MTRIAFRHIDSKLWQGGANYLKNLCRVLLNHQELGFEPIMFHGPEIRENDRQHLEELLGPRLIEHDAFQRRSLARRRWRSLLTGKDKVSLKLFRDNQIDVVFENADFYGAKFPIATMAWAPDFQHRYFPNLFPRHQYWRREIGFRLQFRHSRQVVVSSHDAAADCKKLYDCKQDQVSVVRFSIPFEELPNQAASDETRTRLQLPEHFFLLPNQFWNHKNHNVVVDALHSMKQSGDCPVVAVTGGASHPSCVQNFERITARVKDLGLEDNFRILGQIAYSDLRALMSGCVALINPSLFEGWSTTVEEAKASRIPMILSNIDVHLEQAQDQAVFFDKHSPENLADCMRSFPSESPTRSVTSSELLNAAEQREHRFVHEFREAAQASLARFAANKSARSS
ncbi:MAG: glycosyltransferase family 1 protein [Planctomycetota bacterium]